jgi:hypothetical protein
VQTLVCKIAVGDRQFWKKHFFIEAKMKNQISLFVTLAILGLAMLDRSLAQEQTPPRANAPFQGRKPPLAPLPENFVLTPELEKAALDYLAQSNPLEAQDLQRFKLADQRRYTMRLKAVLDEKARLEFFQKDDPARYERELKIRDLERQSRELSENYRKTPDEAARKTMRTNLSNVIAQLFDLREVNRQDEVKRMQADLKRLIETLELRQKNRVNIIERRIQQLTGEAGAMEWE